MDEASIGQAIERIEAALARIESASAKAGDLGRRHRNLKASVSRSLEQLDLLIAGKEP